jgi:hypothetical protein
MPASTAAAQISACADQLFAMIAADRACGRAEIPAGIRSLAALRQHTDVGYYLTEAIPHDGAECNCPANRAAASGHADGCAMAAPANRAAWQAWQALIARVEQEADRRVAAGELDQEPALDVIFAALVSRYTEAVLALIAEDKTVGHVPAWVFSFSGLHDWADANTYLIDAIPQGTLTSEQWMDLTVAVENEVNDRLVAAELARGRQITEPGDGFTEVTTQCCHRFAVRFGEVAGQVIPCPGQNPRTFAPCGMPLALPGAAEDPVIWVRWGNRLPQS